MITETYQTTIDLTIQPVWHEQPPLIRVKCFDQCLQTYIDETRTFSFRRDASPGKFDISLEFLNKQDSDTVIDQGLDKAVIIQSVAVNGIRDQKFIWIAEYRPEYPEPWYSQQDTVPPAILIGQTYLGWNGTWSLRFAVPAFQWIHQVKSLGWVFE